MGSVTLYAGADIFTDPLDNVPLVSGSGFSTLIVDALDVDGNGDFLWKNDTLVSNGAWVGDPTILQNWLQLKEAPSTIQTFRLGIGTQGTDDFSQIESLLSGGGGPLWSNIQALKTILPVLDGFDLSDWYMASAEGVVAFCKAAASCGFDISFNPCSGTTEQSAITYWQNVWSTWHNFSPGSFSPINLGDFAGTDPTLFTQWAAAIPGAAWIPSIPYLIPGTSQGRCPDSYTFMLGQMAASNPIAGGAMYFYDDFANSPPPWPHCQQKDGGNCQLTDYAAAIATAA